VDPPWLDDTGRNPFAGMSWRLPLALLAEPRRSWTVSELARTTGLSQSMASRVCQTLVSRDLVTGSVSRGSAASLQGTDALLLDAGDHLPPPWAWVAGRTPDADRVVMGGGPAEAAYGVRSTGEAVVYLRRRADARELLADWGGVLAAGPGVDHYALVVLDTGWPPGLVPIAMVAVALISTPRGREVLEDADPRSPLAVWRAQLRSGGGVSTSGSTPR